MERSDSYFTSIYQLLPVSGIIHPFFLPEALLLKSKKKFHFKAEKDEEHR